MAEQDRIDNANKACLGAGVNKIDSFIENSAEAIFCNEWYELIVEAELSLYDWRFATKTVDISANLLSAAPTTKYNTAYTIPGDARSTQDNIVLFHQFRVIVEVP